MRCLNNQLVARILPTAPQVLNLEAGLGVLAQLVVILRAYASLIGNIRIILCRVVSGVPNMANGSNNTLNDKTNSTFC